MTRDYGAVFRASKLTQHEYVFLNKAGENTMCTVHWN